RGAYAIDGLVLKKQVDTSKYPFLEIKRTDLSVEWKQIFKGELVGEIIMDQPSMHILKESADLSKEHSKKHWSETLKDLMPLTINKLEMNNGKFTYLDFSASPNIDLHIDSMQLVALNLANVEDSTSTKLPSTISLSGTSVGQGRLDLKMKANVLKEIPDVDMN